MAENTKIEWTDHTFNPWEGCQKVGPGCDNCYAETRNARFAGGQAINWGPGAPRRRTSAANWNKPKAWNANADAFLAEHGRRQRVFCASLADVFDNAVDPQWRVDLFRLIASTPNLDWLLLTKRIGNVRNMAQAAMGMVGVIHKPLPPNLWIGATITSQEEADRDIPKLLSVPAQVRFLSMEPLLGPVDLQKSCTARCPNGGSCFLHGTGHRVVVDSENGGTLMECICSRMNGIHWVIVGGESGTGARPMHPDWARSLRDQCAAAGVPFLFKQWGEWAPGSGDFGAGRFQTCAVSLSGTAVEGGYDTATYPPGATSGDSWAMVHRAGKKAAGRLLDGRTHDGFPEPRGQAVQKGDSHG